LVVGRYQPLADGSGCLCCPLPDQTCLLQSLQKTKRSISNISLPTIIFGLCADFIADIGNKTLSPHKAQKGRRWKTASLRRAQ
jgi:hypothetical protein